MSRVVTLLFVLAFPLTLDAQFIVGLSPEAFGAPDWEDAVATFGDLPGCTPDELGDARHVTSESAIYLCNGSAWVAVSGGGGGGGAHASTHQDGGSDEISVTGLTGLLADAQTPLSHTHVPAQISPQGAASGLDADLLDGVEASTLEESAEIDADIAAHAALANAHPHRQYARRWVVDQGGSGDYATLTDALNAVTGCSQTAMCLIEVGPGLYAENFPAFPAHTVVAGAGGFASPSLPSGVPILFPSATSGTLFDLSAVGTWLTDLNLYQASPLTGDATILLSDGYSGLENVVITAGGNANGHSLTMLEATAATVTNGLWFSNLRLWHFIDGSTTTAILTTGAAELVGYDLHVSKTAGAAINRLVRHESTQDVEIYGGAVALNDGARATSEVSFGPSSGELWCYLIDFDPARVDSSQMVQRLPALAGRPGFITLDGDLAGTGSAFNSPQVLDDSHSHGSTTITSLPDDSVELDQLAACSGPTQIVEYGASGVPTCITTPSGGGGEPSGTAGTVAAFESDGTGIESTALTVNGNDLELANPARLSFKAGAGTLPIALSGWIDGYLLIQRAATNVAVINNSFIRGYAATGGGIYWAGASSTSPGLVPRADDTNTGLGHVGADEGSFIAGGSQVGGWKKSGAELTLYASDLFQITPQASAPTCAENGQVYVDTSGALCFCDGTSWSKAAGSGSCS